MDIDFALVLVVLTLLALLCWIVDRVFFLPSRRRHRAEIDALYPDWKLKGSDDERTVRMMHRDTPLTEQAIEGMGSLFPVLALVLVLRSFLIEPFQIPSASMVPTLEVGDFILVNKYAYGLRLPVLGTRIVDVGEPQRGDVMVFFPPHDKRYFIKRVIGLPGDRIEIRDRVLTINGERADQSLLAELSEYPPGPPSYRLLEEDLGGVSHRIRVQMFKPTGRTAMGYDPDNMSLVVRPGHYFLMGDNRDNSADSRFWGQVPEQNIVGKAFAIWMHWDEFFSLPSFHRVGGID